MMRFAFRRKRADESAREFDLEALVAAAQSGDADARETLLTSYLPFIDRVVANSCGRAVARTEDEFQIALVAMNEALDAYKLGKGSFISFAETVMKRRLIDYFRVRMRLKEVPMSSYDEKDDEGSTYNTVEVKTAVTAYSDQEQQSLRALEIEQYAKELETYGITFEQLITVSPKHMDARDHALSIAQMIARDPELRAIFLSKKSLPLKQLESRVTVSRKTLERQRTYIVAVVILLLGDYEQLNAFVQKGGER